MSNKCFCFVSCCFVLFRVSFIVFGIQGLEYEDPLHMCFTSLVRHEMMSVRTKGGTPGGMAGRALSFATL